MRLSGWNLPGHPEAGGPINNLLFPLRRRGAAERRSECHLETHKNWDGHHGGAHSASRSPRSVQTGGSHLGTRGAGARTAHQEGTPSPTPGRGRQGKGVTQQGRNQSSLRRHGPPPRRTRQGPLCPPPGVLWDGRGRKCRGGGDPRGLPCGNHESGTQTFLLNACDPLSETPSPGALSSPASLQTYPDRTPTEGARQLYADGEAESTNGNLQGPEEMRGKHIRRPHTAQPRALPGHREPNLQPNWTP